MRDTESKQPVPTVNTAGTIRAEMIAENDANNATSTASHTNTKSNKRAVGNMAGCFNENVVGAASSESAEIAGRGENGAGNSEGTGSAALEEISTEYECVICLKLLWQPVTTPCGHNFCKICIEECIEHRAACPLCRAPIPPGRPQNILLGQLLQKLFPKAMKMRQREIHLAELKHHEKQQQIRDTLKASLQELPVFRLRRGTPLFPGEVITLHAFEPRYIRLVDMVLQGTREFGILTTAPANNAHQEVGTCVKIESYDRVSTAGDRYFIVCKAQYRFVLTEETILTGHGYEVTTNYVPLFDNPLFSVDLDVIGMVDDTFQLNEREFTIEELIKRMNHNSTLMELSGGFDLGESEPTSSHGATSTHNQSNAMPRMDNSRDQGLRNNLGHTSDANFVNAYKQLMDIGEKHFSNPTARYLVACYAALLCFIGLRRKLRRSGDSGQRLFFQKFGQQPAMRDLPTSSDLEDVSFYLCRVVVATRLEKWSWFTTKDTLSRIQGVADKLILAPHNVLDLGFSRFSGILNLFMLDSSMSTIFCFAAVIAWCLVIRLFVSLSGS